MDRSSLTELPMSSLGGLSGLAGGGGQFQSPFLSVDPSVLTPSQQHSTPGLLSSEQFIFPDGATKSSRGRFELAFGQIGCSVGAGAGIGGAMGTLRGLREVTKMGGEAALSVKRTHLLNNITRNGAIVGNTFGTIALIYSALGVGLSLLQEENDELNTALAATTTGTLYGALSGAKAAEGLTGSAMTRFRVKRAGFGLAGGMIASAVLIFAMNQEKFAWSKYR
ncbi:mitochondrial import inner membrane translocase, subunit timm23 [Tyrophagus putrescentiae]|nr:mitochondrial import inner membrane translocase, subunit timm23 [Tyrophagus putrescentiae]